MILKLRTTILSLSAVLISAPLSGVCAQDFKVEESVKGGVVKPLTGPGGGLPRSILPSARFMSMKDFFGKFKDRSKTPSGLYILDAGFVPYSLPATLKADGLSLLDRGDLVDAKRQKVTMVVFPRAYSVEVDKADAGDNNFWPFKFIGSAKAADPYPLSWVGVWASWRTPSGFCRTVRANTYGDSYGPEQAGARPHTRIQYIETRAGIGSIRDRDSCRNCDAESSHASWHVGCFWPAYGASGSHFANFAEGDFSWTWTFSW
ncbi:MAG: hypothetical protein OEL78_04280 [Hyphomicrobiales bacterium]|nr:hypothetical protein [Hyphomicrobiales bacterium]